MLTPADSEYIKGLKNSDREAFAALFRLLREPLIRYVVSIVKEDMIAHDLVQDCFIDLWKAREILDPEKPFNAYIYQMARNRALRHLRDTRLRESKHEHIKQNSSREIPVEQWPDAGMDSDSLGKKLKEWLLGLPERQREALELSRYQGLSHKEIAEIMEISPSTVNTHITLAIKNLRRTIETLDPVLI